MFLICQKKILLLIFCFLSLSVFAEEKSNDCADLSSMFIEYENDSQLHNHSLYSTIVNMKKILKELNETGKLQAELLIMIKDLEHIGRLILDNQMNLLDRSDNFLFHLEDCMSRL